MKYSKNNDQLPDWNRDEVWSKIEERMAHKKRRRPVLWWWFGIGLALLGAGLYFSQNEPATEVAEQKQLPLVETVNEASKVDFSDLKNDSFETKKSTQNIDNQPIAENNFSKKEIKTNKEAGYKKAKTVTETTLFQKNNSKFSSLNEMKTFKGDSGEKFSSLLKDKNLKTAENQKITLEKLAPVFSILKIKNSALNLENPIPETKAFSDEKINQKSNSNLRFFVEAGAMTGSVNYFGESDFINRRNASETLRFALDFTAGAEKVFDKNWFVKTGLTYRSIFEKYEYTTDSLIVNFQPSDSAKIYDLGNGEFFVEPGIVRTETNTKRAIVHNNFLHRLSIPLTGGYIFRKGKMSIAPEVGLRLRFFQKHTGVVAFSDAVHRFENADLYSNFDIGFIGGVSGRYEFSKGNSFGLNLRFEQEDFFKISSLTNGSRYRFLGGNLGWYRSF